MLHAAMAHGQGSPPPKPRPLPPVLQPAPQGQQGKQGQQPRPPRRALDIRAQAPAPEVVTIRPREIPLFSRALISPAIYQPPVAAQTSGDRTGGTVVILPGTLPIVAGVPGARPANRKPPENPQQQPHDE
jgi:hypothetical protein